MLISPQRYTVVTIILNPLSVVGYISVNARKFLFSTINSKRHNADQLICAKFTIQTADFKFVQIAQITLYIGFFNKFEFAEPSFADYRILIQIEVVSA